MTNKSAIESFELYAIVSNPNVGSAFLMVIVTFLIWHVWSKRQSGSPPGTNGLPLLGSALSLQKFPERVFEKWGKKYGPIYMVKIGKADVVILGSKEVANEAFAKNDCFNERMNTIPTMDRQGLLQVNFTDFYKEQRRFFINTLRDIGMGRRSLEPRLLEVTEKLCQRIDDLCGDGGTSEAFQITTALYTTISSVICKIIFNREFDEISTELQDLVHQIVTPPVPITLLSILMFAPFLKTLPVFSAVWKSSLEFKSRMHDAVKQEVGEHQKSRDPDNPRDFIDFFLNEIEKSDAKKPIGKNKNPSAVSSFSSEQLLAIVRDMFIAGLDTTATTTSWLVLYMCKYPDVQKKMQQEIDDVLGQSGVPRMSIMEKLPYVRAVIQEVTRIRPVVPLSVPHMASRDASLLGYRIPKGAIILTNIWAIHHDETRWPEPDKFSPERHLDEDGKFIKSSETVNFSVGGRSCPGRQLADMEIFLATVTLFRRFQFSLPTGESPDICGENAIVLRPFTFNVIAMQR